MGLINKIKWLFSDLKFFNKIDIHSFLIKSFHYIRRAATNSVIKLHQKLIIDQFTYNNFTESEYNFKIGNIL
jgi:hypothetical protein